MLHCPLALRFDRLRSRCAESKYITNTSGDGSGPFRSGRRGHGGEINQRHDVVFLPSLLFSFTLHWASRPVPCLPYNIPWPVTAAAASQVSAGERWRGGSSDFPLLLVRSSLPPPSLLSPVRPLLRNIMQSASTTTAVRSATKLKSLLLRARRMSARIRPLPHYKSYVVVVPPSHTDMPLHVEGKVVRSGEGPFAKSTLEGPVSCVLPKVPGQLV